MAVERRIRLDERHSMERGLRCPECGTYTSFSDIIVTGQCRGALRDDCDADLALDLVVEE
jgi:hypothetical protein